MIQKSPKIIEQTEEKGSARSFLQPLAVALASTVLVIFVFIMGLMDLRTLDKTLTGYMRNRGLDIIKNVQQTTELHFERLLQTQILSGSLTPVVPLTEDSFSLQESLIVDLLEFAHEIESKIESGQISNETAKSLVTNEGLWLVTFLDERGAITFENRPTPLAVLRFAAPVITGQQEININLFNRARDRQWTGFVALRQKSGRGSILLALDDKGFRYRSLRVAVQKAIVEAGQISSPGYFLAIDKNRTVIGQGGDLPMTARKDLPVIDILGGDIDIFVRKLNIEGMSLLEIAAPLKLDNSLVGMVLLGLSVDKANEILKSERTRVFISMAFMMGIAVLSMLFLYMNQNRHLKKMQELERRLQRAERLSALGRLAAGMAHEIRNPLNAISMAGQRLQRSSQNKFTGVIRDEIRRLNQIVDEFLIFSKDQKLELKHYDLKSLLQNTVLLIREEAESKGVTIKTVWDSSPLMVSMDADKLKQAFINILKNAIESISDEGLITISIDLRGKKWVCVQISDTGDGISIEEIDRIFDPDYTTKEKGLGLGLSLAHEIIQGHKGEIHVNSQPGSGSTFEILLPLGESSMS